MTAEVKIGSMTVRVAMPDNVVNRLRDLHQQATVERSHFYVGSTVQAAIAEIEALRMGITTLMSAIEGEGYRIMANISKPGHLSIERGEALAEVFEKAGKYEGLCK